MSPHVDVDASLRFQHFLVMWLNFVNLDTGFDKSIISRDGQPAMINADGIRTRTHLQYCCLLGLALFVKRTYGISGRKLNSVLH